MDAGRLADLERRAARGDTARTEQENQERDRIIDAAIRAGKVPKSRQAHWVSQWKVDVEGTKKLLTAKVEDGGLAPGLVPVDEQGASPSDEALSDEAYPAHWLPEVQARQGGEGVPTGMGGLVNKRGM